MTTLSTRLWMDFQYIRRQFPGASDIRVEDDKCPNCKHQGRFYSYQLPDDIANVKPDRDGVWMEHCGYICMACGWGNAGRREMHL